MASFVQTVKRVLSSTSTLLQNLVPWFSAIHNSIGLWVGIPGPPIPILAIPLGQILGTDTRIREPQIEIPEMQFPRQRPAFLANRPLGKLRVVKIRVKAPGLNQLVVAALFDNVAVLHHLLDQDFRARVDGACRLVQNKAI